MANDIRTSLVHRLNTKMYAEILQDAHELSNMSICVGLIGVDEKLYIKGAANHFGVPFGNHGQYIPPRRWLDAGTGVNQVISQGRYEYLHAFREIVEFHLSNPRQQAIVGKKDENGIIQFATPALSGFKGRGPKRILNRIAKTVAENMQSYIRDGFWIPNAESTAKSKGFNWPLYETGELVNSIKWEVRYGDTVQSNSGSSGSNAISEI